MKLGANCGCADRWHLTCECGYDYAEAYFAGITLAEDYEGELKAAFPIMKLF